MTRGAGLVVAAVLVLAACTSGQPESSAGPSSVGPSSVGPTSVGPPLSAPSSTASAPASPGEEFDAASAMAAVREITAFGPREATSGAYRAAADLVADRLAALGFDVTRTRLRLPAGVSWGVPVGAGRTTNVVARMPGAGTGHPVVVGAHLDTVPQAPGAEDNASGVAVLLELARLAAATGTARPVTFVVFGGEEPRGPGDDQHHFGSQSYVSRLRGVPVHAMVSLDRVGVRGSVPVCTGGLSPPRVRRQLIAAAHRVGVRTRACVNRTSDHWPFEKAGHAVARLGGNDYPAYHSARDRSRVVSRSQLDRVGRVMWEWLRAA